MPGLAHQLSGPQFEQLLADLRAISAEPTLEQIRAVMIRHGVKSPTSKDGTPSKMAAATLRDGPFRRYIERLNAGRETREQLCAAAGAGVHALDAIEEAAVIELQDHLTSAQTIDIEWLTKQLVKLRTSISMREDSHRKQTELEAKLRESEAKVQIAEQRRVIAEEQAKKLERERQEWQRKQESIAAQLVAARKAKGKGADEIRAAAVDEIDRIMGIAK